MYNFFQSVFTKDNGTTPQLIPTDNTGISPIDAAGERTLSLSLDLDQEKLQDRTMSPILFFGRYAEWCSKFLGLVFRKSLAVSKPPVDWKKS